MLTMKTTKFNKITALFTVVVAATIMMLALCACAPKEITVNVVDGDATTEVTTQEGKTVEEILAANDITLEEGDVVEPALDTKIEGSDQTITIERLNKVVVAVDGKNVDVEVLGGTVQDALDQAEVVLADGDTVDIEVVTPLENGMLITVTRAVKEQPKASSNASSSSNKQSSASSSQPAKKTIVSKTAVPNCDDESHGYYEIVWSDGTTTYQEY